MGGYLCRQPKGGGPCSRWWSWSGVIHGSGSEGGSQKVSRFHSLVALKGEEPWVCLAWEDPVLRANHRGVVGVRYPHPRGNHEGVGAGEDWLCAERLRVGWVVVIRGSSAPTPNYATSVVPLKKMESS